MSDELLRQAVATAKQGNRAEAVRLTKQFIKANKDDERGWYALAKLVEDDDIKIKSLKRVLELNPSHTKAREMLDVLEPPSFGSDLFSFEDSNDEDDGEMFSSQTYAGASSSLFDDSPFQDAPATASPVPDANVEAMAALQQAEAARSARRSSTRQRSGGSVGEFIIGLGVFMLAIVAFAGLGYYAYFYQHLGLFGLLGPDLSETATTSEVRVRFPSEWDAIIENDAVIAGTGPLTSAIECESMVEDAMGLALLGDGAAASALMGNQQFDMAVYPVTPQLLADINACDTTFSASNGRELVEQNIAGLDNVNESEDGVTIRIESDFKTITIAGVDGLFSYGTLYMKADVISFEIAIGSYMASFERDGQEYVFLMSVVGDGADSQQRLAERILRTIEFVG